MNYQTFQPHADLNALVKCYWTLEVPAEPETPRQRIIPDGCIEMAFILGDDIKRYTSETAYILQPRVMVLGQITEPFYIQPTGYVNTFAIRFYPYGFANFVKSPIKNLANKETALELLFGDLRSRDLELKIVHAKDTKERIVIIENFLLETLSAKATVDKIVKTTIDVLVSRNGNTRISSILTDSSSQKRQLERKFARQIGLSPKQLGKVIRLQAALKMLLNRNSGKLTDIAYDSDYYDQAHFIRDFREFTGTTPTEFLEDKNMVLSSLIYKKA
jgi:AraC-like DNA-binding protein